MYKDIKATFNEDETKNHETIRELLWLMYPQDKSEESSPVDDLKADEVATYIVDALKRNCKAVMA